MQKLTFNITFENVPGPIMDFIKSTGVDMSKSTTINTMKYDANARCLGSLLACVATSQNEENERELILKQSKLN